LHDHLEKRRHHGPTSILEQCAGCGNVGANAQGKSLRDQQKSRIDRHEREAVNRWFRCSGFRRAPYWICMSVKNIAYG
jgi:hypothetical protein